MVLATSVRRAHGLTGPDGDVSRRKLPRWMSDDVRRRGREQIRTEFLKGCSVLVRGSRTDPRYGGVESRGITIVHYRDLGIFTIDLGHRNLRPGNPHTNQQSQHTGQTSLTYAFFYPLGRPLYTTAVLANESSTMAKKPLHPIEEHRSTAHSTR